MGKEDYFSDRLFRVFLCALVLAISVVSVAAQSADFTTKTYSVLGNNHVVADFNGDGKLDLAGVGKKAAAVMLGNGDGTFKAQTAYPVAGVAQDIAAGDFNNDGKIDLILTINRPKIGLSLLLGNGDGTFQAPINFPNSSGADSPAIVATDLNNDGNLDIVVAHQAACFTVPCLAARSITVMLGNGNGTFQAPHEISVGTGMSRIAVGDFNRDGVKDLGICGDNAQLYILLGNGDGSFAQQPTTKLITKNPNGVDGTDINVADLNGDNVQDLVVSIALNGSYTAVLLGNGDGTFRSPSIITEPNIRIPHHQAIADYNGDGKPDLALALGWGSQGLMEILHGNGDGTFQAPVLYLVPSSQLRVSGGAIISGDFNGDNKPDIALQVDGASPALDVLISPAIARLPSASPVTVSALTLSAPSVTGGNRVTGTVTLSATSDTATIVSLASNQAAASVQTILTIPAGAASATFNIGTTKVATATVATITATVGKIALSTSLTIDSTASVDTLTVNSATFDTATHTLTIEASSTVTGAVLKVFVTSNGQLIGTITGNGGTVYNGTFNVAVNPKAITVRSSLGGQVTHIVTAK